MAHTDRQPTLSIFKDIQDAAMQVWLNGDYHRDYADGKINEIYATPNFADNWNHIIGMFDVNNQMLFYHYLKLQDSVDFLKTMRAHYHIFIPREKVTSEKTK